MTRRCLHCGRELRRHRSDARYCAPTCRAADHRTRHNLADALAEAAAYASDVRAAFGRPIDRRSNRCSHTAS